MNERTITKLKKSWIPVIIMTCFVYSGFGRNLNTLSPGDTIVVEISNRYGMFYRHIFKPKQTLYSISRMLGSSPEEVYDFNPTLKNESIRIGESVIIPVRKKVIITREDNLISGEEYIPVYYRVGPKETLFRIASQYFFQSRNELMERNGLRSTHLDNGQLLHVGWVMVGGKDPEIARADDRDSLELLAKNNMIETPESRRSRVESEEDREDKREFNMVIKRGTAVWDKDNSDDKNLFVLHSNAKINSVIELYNPMLERKVYAEVIGKMPANIYPKDITLLVSPKVAQMLGIRDTRFLVEMRYLE